MSESQDVYMCPEFKNAIDMFKFTLTNVSYFDEMFKPKLKYLFCGQPGLQKTVQLQKLLEMDDFLTIHKVKELIIDADINVTTETINSFTTTPDTIIIIHNFHYLQYMRNEPSIAPFAFNLSKLSNPIIAISDLPVDDSDTFCAQFEEIVIASPPTQDFLERQFELYFTRWRAIIAENKLPIQIDSTMSYTWLAQHATYCTVEDVSEFMNRIYYIVLTEFRQHPEKTPIVITQDTFEDPNWKFMHETDGHGILSITQRDARRDQNIYLTRFKAGCLPQESRKRKTISSD